MSKRVNKFYKPSPSSPSFDFHLGQHVRCEHGAEKGFCLVRGCWALVENVVNCGRCEGLHVRAFVRVGLPCEADFEVASKYVS